MSSPSLLLLKSAPASEGGRGESTPAQATDELAVEDPEVVEAVESRESEAFRGRPGTDDFEDVEGVASSHIATSSETAWNRPCFRSRSCQYISDIISKRATGS